MDKQINRYQIINVIANLRSMKRIGVSPVIQVIINICIGKLKNEIKQTRKDKQ